MVAAAENSDASDRSRPVPASLLLIAGGLVAAWAWLTFSPGWAEAAAVALAPESLAATMAIFYLVVFAPLISIAFLMGALGKVSVAVAGRAPISALFGGTAIGAGGLALALALSGLASENVAGGQATGLTGLVMLGFVLILLQVSAEELLLRGWLQPALTPIAGPALAIVLTAVAFAILHLAASEAGLLALANITLAGVLFGSLRFVSGGLFLPIAAHFGWNALEDVGLGAFPNPGIGAFGGITDVDIIGPLHWGGGAQGLNDSLGTTVVLLAMILVVAAFAGKRQ